MPIYEDKDFGSYVAGLPAADDSVLSAGNDTLVQTAAGVKKLDAKNVTKEKDFSDLKFKKHGVNEQNVSFYTGSYLSKTNGELVSFSALCLYSDFIQIEQGNSFIVSAKTVKASCIVAVYDENKSFIMSIGKTTGSEIFVEWNNEVILADGIINSAPNAKYVRFGSYNKPSSSVVKFEKFYNCDEAYESCMSGLFSLKKDVSFEKNGVLENLNFDKESGKYIHKGNGNVSSVSGASCTDFIILENYENFVINANAAFQTCIYAVYDVSKDFIASYGKTSVSGEYVTYTRKRVDVKDILSLHPTAKYIRFSSFTSSVPLVVCKLVPFKNDSAYESSISKNILFGKKWVACGDSFTHGMNLGTNGYDEIYCVYKSYPWWISQRNGMNLVQMSSSGQVIHNDSTKTNKFTPDKYKGIPSDADYVTLSWGLNETGVTIGDSSSSDDSTLWGAFNEVISYILENNPKCKIGIIIQDAWMTSTIAEAEKDIGEYWGIPVLDLKFGKEVPMGIDGRTGCSAVASAARNSVFRDGTGHPTIEAHEYRSTFIENWLRSL